MSSWRRAWALVVACLSTSLVLPSPSNAAIATTITAQVSSEPQRWSDPATWGGSIPSAGDRVVIPGGAKVLLDTSSPSLTGLQVDGSLRFANRDLELTSRWIVVHGALRVGSETKPFTSRATITLTGAESEASVMDMGTKVLGVMGGRLDLHGKRVPGWTRLGATAAPGSRTITLASSPPWRPGDRIVIASSDYWDHHDEERTITRITGNTIELDQALTYRHWGEIQTFGGQEVDERAEVGLLSRNIVVRGDATSVQTGFGAHTMIMEGGIARIEGVEFQNVGQKQRLRRYPVHFHMEGAAPDSYLRRSSIHDSFNRCVTIHGTQQLRVQNNVCYNHLGHGFFLEDGSETDNVITGNLGLGTQKVEDGLLPSDERPATFWITNPDNIVRNNVAAGSDSFGFWYALPEHPTGLSGSESIWPRRTPLASFRGNVAHSNGDTGLNVDHGPRPDGETEVTWYRPVTNPADEDSAPVVARFEDFTAYMNRDRGVWLRGENHIVTGSVFADNRAAATFASEESFLVDSLVVGETANKGMTESWEKQGYGGRALPFFWEPDAPILGFEFYDGRVGVSGTTFANFNDNPVRRSGALGYLSPDAFSIHPKNFAEDVSFVDATPVYLSEPEAGMDGDLSKVFVDRDGSVTGAAGKTVVVNNPFLLTPGCERREAWNAFICGNDYVTLYAGSDDDDPADIKPLTLTRDDGVAQVLNGCCDDSTSAVTSLIPNRGYDVAFTGGTPSGTRFVLWRGSGTWLRLSLPVGAAFTVKRWGYPLPSRSSLEALDMSSGSSYYYDTANGKLHLKIVAKDTDWEEVRIRH